MRWTARQLARQIECAKAAGIYDQMFIAFGSLLGYVRNGGVIPGDDDLDVGFVSEAITKEQEREYVRLAGEPTNDFPNHGLFEYRREMSFRPDNGCLFWLSIRGRPASECLKCCHWFFWRQQGFVWHCKGNGSLVKGLPMQSIEPGPVVEFLGQKIRIPKRAGALLDHWYPDWFTTRQGGNSSKKIIMSVNKWKPISGIIVEDDISN